MTPSDMTYQGLEMSPAEGQNSRCVHRAASQEAVVRISERYTWEITRERPSFICQSCWDGVFSAHLGLLHPPLLRSGREDSPPSGGYSYTCTWEGLRSQAIGGCRWCQLILSTNDENSRIRIAETSPTVIVGIRPQFGYLGSPKDTQALCLFVNNSLRFEGYLYTDAGEFSLRDGPGCSS